MPFLAAVVPTLLGAAGVTVPAALTTGLGAAASAFGVAQGIAQGDPLAAALSAGSGIAGGLGGGIGGLGGATIPGAQNAGSTLGAIVPSSIHDTVGKGLETVGQLSPEQFVQAAGQVGQGTKGLGLADAFNIANTLGATGAGIYAALKGKDGPTRDIGLSGISTNLPAYPGANAGNLPSIPNLEVGKASAIPKLDDNDLLLKLLGAYQT